jgi:prepilin-type N-terminal cleavage/methylation domain-containing protein
MMRAKNENAGFTLIEVLLAIVILAVVVAMVYTSFSSVTTTIGVSRVRSEELRLRQFLERSLQTNFASVYIDQGLGLPGYQFIGIDEDSPDGAIDSIRFASSASMMGGLALPGDLKEVRYEVLGVEGRIGDFSLEEDIDEDAGPQLRATETPLAVANLMALSGEVDDPDRDTESDLDFEAPTWTVPIRSFDVSYYDGMEWVDEWDSEVVGRLPWSVHVKINFARTEEQIEQEEDDRIDIEEDPDFEMMIPLPAGIGRIQDGREIASMESERDLQGRQLAAQQGGVQPGRGQDTADGNASVGTSVFGMNSGNDDTPGAPKQ